MHIFKKVAQNLKSCSKVAEQNVSRPTVVYVTIQTENNIVLHIDKFYTAVKKKLTDVSDWSPSSKWIIHSDEGL